MRTKDDRASVNSRSNRTPKFGAVAILSPMLLLALLLNAGCGEFHSQAASSAANTNAAAATPAATPDDGSDGWWSGPTPTPTPTPSPSATPTATPGATATPVSTPTPTPSATPVATPRPIVSANFRVMTYNIKAIPCLRDNAISAIGGLFGVKECPLVNDGWTQHNRARITDLLINIQTMRNNHTEPDVILFQEAWTAKNDIFDDDPVLSIPARSGYPYVAWGPSAKISNGFDDYWKLINQDQKGLRGLLSSGLLILSKHPIVAQATTEYGDICQIDDCNAAKGALYVRIHHAGLNQDIDVITTHMQAGSGREAVRSMQTDLLTGFIASKRTTVPVILGGDFNTRMQYKDAEMAKIQSVLGLRHQGEACVAAGPGSCTVAGDTRASVLAGDKLDHIFANAQASGQTTVTPVSGQVPPWMSGGIPLSDHDAVIMDLRLDHSL